MSKLVFGGLAALLALVWVSESRAETTLNANAVVYGALSASEARPLVFGRVVSSASLGTVTITSAGARNFSGGVTGATGGGEQSGQITINGASGAVVTLSYAQGTPLTSGANTISMDNFTAAAPAGGASPVTATLTGGTATVDVGARANLSANQAAGSYAGTIDVTIAYQ